MTRSTGNRKSGKPPENDSGYSPSQIVEMGSAASQLLGNPVYNLTHRLAVDDLIGRWSTTRPEEVKLRESLWHEMQAHGRAVAGLGSLVERAREILEKQQPQNEEQDYLDKQGFGYSEASSDFS